MNFSSLVVVALAKLGKEGSKGRYRGHGMAWARRGVAWSELLDLCMGRKQVLLT